MKFKQISKAILPALFIGFSLAGCAPSLSPNTYSSFDAAQPSDVVKGVVDSMRVVVVSGDTLTPGGGMAGTLIGGATGAIVGSTIGQGGGNVLATVAGGLIGAGIGNLAEHQITQQQAMEYVIHTNFGSYVSIVQAINPPLYRGEHVLVIYSDRPRVVPDPAYEG